MASKRSSEAFAALSAVAFLLVAASGNSLALLVAAAAALVLGWVFFRPRESGRIALVTLIGAVGAALVVVAAKLLH